MKHKFSVTVKNDTTIAIPMILGSVVHSERKFYLNAVWLGKREPQAIMEFSNEVMRVRGGSKMRFAQMKL